MKISYVQVIVVNYIFKIEELKALEKNVLGKLESIISNRTYAPNLHEWI